MLRSEVPPATPLTEADTAALFSPDRLLPGWRVEAEMRVAGRDVRDAGEGLVFGSLALMEPVRRPTQYRQSANRIGLAAVSDGAAVRHAWWESLTEWPVLMAADWLADGVVSQPVRLAASLSGGTSTWHVPDLLVFDEDARCLIDVRDRQWWDLSFAAHSAWTSAFAQSLGLDYYVATSLPRTVTANLMQVRQSMRSPAHVIARAAVILSALTAPRAMAAMIPGGQEGRFDYQACLWLIWTGQVDVDLRRPIDRGSVLAPATEATTLRSFLTSHGCLADAHEVCARVHEAYRRGVAAPRG